MKIITLLTNYINKTGILNLRKHPKYTMCLFNLFSLFVTLDFNYSASLWGCFKKYIHNALSQNVQISVIEMYTYNCILN